MLRIKKILFPTDFTDCANQALAHAVYLARKYDAELHLLHAIVLHEEDPQNPEHRFPNVEEVLRHLQRNADNQMTAEIEALKEDGLQVKKASIRGISPAPVILEYAKDEDVDLILMGTHGRRGLGHLLLGSVTEEVVRVARRPVMTVRQQEKPQEIEAIERILVPVDFSEHSKNAVSYAREIASTYGAQLQMLHVIEETVHPAFYVTGRTSIFEFIPDLKEKSEEALTKLLGESRGPEVGVENHVVEGRAAREITHFAEENGSDLIVISTHGLTGLDHFLMGSVTEKVVRTSPCPVFTVKSFGKSLI